MPPTTGRPLVFVYILEYIGSIPLHSYLLLLFLPTVNIYFISYPSEICWYARTYAYRSVLSTHHCPQHANPFELWKKNTHNEIHNIRSNRTRKSFVQIKCDENKTHNPNAGQARIVGLSEMVKSEIIPNSHNSHSHTPTLLTYNYITQTHSQCERE